MYKSIKTALILICLLSLGIQNINAQDDIVFRKYIYSSAWNGLYYGLALDYVANLEGGAAAGIPILTTGVSIITPLILQTQKDININSLILSRHGKTIGWAYGMSTVGLFMGVDEDLGKPLVAVGALSSIGLGRLGLVLGKKYDWDEGLAAMYSHYGYLGAYTGASLGVSIADDEESSFRMACGLTVLSGLGGYLLGHTVYQLNPYTRGDVRATQVLSLFHLGLGYSLFIDKDEIVQSDIMFPAVGALIGTGIGHLWMKNTTLSTRQGTYAAYAALGGGIIGASIPLMAEAETFRAYYLGIYLGGMTAFGLMVEKFRRDNYAFTYPKEKHNNNWDFSFMPQNIFFNQILAKQSQPGRYNNRVSQPAFVASLKF